MDYGEPGGGSYPGFPIPAPLNINAETMFGHCPKTKKRKKKSELTVGIYVEQGENWGSW